LLNSLGGIYEEIITALQESVDTWERGLNATSGAIVPEKTFWFLIDFAWKAGQWRYKSIDESPGLTKSPYPQVISLEWGLVSGRRLFYLLDDQSKDKI